MASCIFKIPVPEKLNSWWVSLRLSLLQKERQSVRFSRNSELGVSAGGCKRGANHAAFWRSMEFSLGESINRSGPDWNPKHGSDTALLPLPFYAFASRWQCMHSDKPAGSSCLARHCPSVLGCHRGEWHHTGWMGPFIYIFCE